MRLGGVEELHKLLRAGLGLLFGHRADGGEQRKGAFLGVDELHREAGIRQRLDAAAAPDADDGIAVLEQLGHLAGRWLPGQHVRAHFLDQRLEARVDIVGTAAVDFGKHQQGLQTVAVVDRRDDGLALELLVFEVVPRGGSGPAGLFEGFFVVEQAGGDDAQVQRLVARRLGHRVEVVVDRCGFDIAAKAELHGLLHRAVVHQRHVVLGVVLFCLELGEGVGGVARHIDHLVARQLLIGRNDLLLESGLGRAAVATDINVFSMGDAGGGSKGCGQRKSQTGCGHRNYLQKVSGAKVKLNLSGSQ